MERAAPAPISLWELPPSRAGFEAVPTLEVPRAAFSPFAREQLGPRGQLPQTSPNPSSKKDRGDVELGEYLPEPPALEQTWAAPVRANGLPLAPASPPGTGHNAAARPPSRPPTQEVRLTPSVPASPVSAHPVSALPVSAATEPAPVRGRHSLPSPASPEQATGSKALLPIPPLSENGAADTTARRTVSPQRQRLKYALGVVFVLVMSVFGLPLLKAKAIPLKPPAATSTPPVQKATSAKQSGP